MAAVLGHVGFAICASDDEMWFAIMGNPPEQDADTVELNVANLPPRGEIKYMELRVNLAHQRSTASGDRFMSYVSRIAIDCEKESVVHVEQTRYLLGQWQGKSTFQRFADVRPMAFSGLMPSPKPRVLKAACPEKP